MCSFSKPLIIARQGVDIIRIAHQYADVWEVGYSPVIEFQQIPIEKTSSIQWVPISIYQWHEGYKAIDNKEEADRLTNGFIKDWAAELLERGYHHLHQAQVSVSRI